IEARPGCANLPDSSSLKNSPAGTHPSGRLRAAAPTGHPGVAGGARHALGDRGGDAFVENAWNDVLRRELTGGHARGQGVRRRDLHLIVHGSRTGVEESAEEAGEAQDVVDLVWIVGAPGGHDAHVTLGFLGLDLGSGLAIAKTMGSRAMRLMSRTERMP